MTIYTVTATATDAATDTVTVSSVTNMFSGMPIVFSGTAFGGITAGATYYIGTIVPGYPTSTITVTSLPGGAIVALSTAAGSMTGTFNSGGQQIIDIGAAPDDGTGDPLRTAFNDTNLNFDQVFAAGPVGSNVQIANNTIKTINTNGNLVLAPNGTGVVQSNVTIVPNTANVRNLGSAAQRWSTIYTQYLDISGTLTTGDLTVDGNLTVQGNIIQVGNIVTETLTIQLANAASTANAANGAGITVGANDNIATMLYSSTSNVWAMNIGANLVGNVTAPYFFGNGSQLTGLPVQYGNANVVTLLTGFGSNTITTTGNITAGYLFGNGSQLTGINVSSSFISNGNSNVNIATANGPVTVSYAGSGNTWTFGDVNVPEALYWPDGSFQATAFVGIAQDLANPGNATITSNNTGNTTYAWNFGSDGRLTFPGTPRIDTDSDNFEVQAAESISLEANAVVNIYTDSSGNAYQWQFGDDGILTFPNNLVIAGNTNVFGLDSALIQQNDGLPIVVSSSGANGAVATYWVEDVGNVGTSNIAAVYVRPTLGSNIVRIAVGQNGNAGPNLWDFDTTGNLTAPGNISAVGNITSGNLTVGSGTVNGGNFNGANFNGNVAFGTGTVGGSGNITGGNISAIGNISGGNVRALINLYVEATVANLVLGDATATALPGLSSTDSIVLNANRGNVEKTYVFGSDGTLTLPGNITLPNGAVIRDTAGDSVAFGQNAGNISQGSQAVAIGLNAGANSQAAGAVAVGSGAGQLGQSITGIAIGDSAGSSNQGSGAVAVGAAAGFDSQGQYSVAMGYYAGNTSQGNNSIILNATGAVLDQTTANTFTVAPVRNDVANVAEVMFYNVTSKEITYGNVISVAGNVTGGNLTTAGQVIATGNITGANLSVTGNISGNTAGFAIGYRDIPQVSFTGNATIATTDAGKHYYSTESTDYILTIANNASQGFQTGAAITVVNQGTGNITIAQGSGVTLYLAGNASSGNRSVATFGMATIMKVATDTWFVSGAGVA